MTYSHLFIDFDDTLYDTHGNAIIALNELYEQLHLDQHFERPEDFTIPYWQANVELWDQYARGEIERQYLIVERFRRPLSCGYERLDVPADQRKHLQPTEDYCLEVSDQFLDLCACKPGVVEGAHELVQYLRQKGYKMHLCSNGFHEVQYRKLRSSQLLEYFDTIVLSEDAGANKPKAAYFDYAFRTTGARPDNTLMIGDNFTTDILGAKSAGLDVLFFNRHPDTFQPTEPINFEVRSLREIMEIL